jgi:hypothetical protein
MNLLDKKIERMAYEILADQDLPIDRIEFAIRELQILIDRGINSRSEIIGLLNLAKRERMVVGDRVKVTSDAGTEYGVVESINRKSGKVDVYFNYGDCPHFCTFNITQVKVVA